MNSLSSYTVECDDVATAAQFVLLCKRGDASAAAEFLKKTLAEVDGSALDLTTLSSTLGYELIGNAPRSHNDTNGGGGSQVISFIGDEIDKQPTTLVMLIPGDMHVVGHVIGKGGLEIGKIELESGASVKIDAHSQVFSNTLIAGNTGNGASSNNIASGQQNERIVTISGTVVSCVKAQRLLDRRLRARLESDGIHREVLRIVVPNEFVRHLIGKGGSNISQLQTQTGIRIQVQAEANMAAHQPGRVVTFQGAEYGRAIAQYLVSRQVCEGPYREWPQPQQQAASPPYSPSWSGSPSSQRPDWTFLDGPQRAAAGQKEQDQIHPMQIPSVNAPHNGHALNLHYQGHYINSTLGAASDAESGAPDSPNPRTISHALDEEPGAHFVSDVQCCVQLTVPNVAVAFLIGKGGSTVGEMEAKSGAKIRIAKSLNGEHEAGRVVVMKGTSGAVRSAQMLVQTRIDSYLASHSSHV